MISAYFCFIWVSRKSKLTERKRESKKYWGRAELWYIFSPSTMPTHTEPFFMNRTSENTHTRTHFLPERGKREFFPPPINLFSCNWWQRALLSDLPLHAIPLKNTALKMKTASFKDSPAICCQLASESLLSRTIVIFLRLFRAPQKLDLDFFHFWPSGRKEMSFHGEQRLKQKDSATDWWICVSPCRSLNMKRTSLRDSRRLPRAPSD